MIKVQMTSDRVPRITARSGFPAGEGKNCFQGVKRTRSDIAENHTQCGQAQGLRLELAGIQAGFQF
jgi:hypothetical protein